MESESNNTEPTIYLLIVNYHCGNIINDLVSSVRHSTNDSIHFVIIDNSVQDASLDRIIALPYVTVLRAERNLGFGAGCNLGLEYIQKNEPDAIVWLLNPDTRLKHRAISIVRQILKECNPAPAILGTRICDREGNPWFDRGVFNPLLGSFTGTRKSGAQTKSNDCRSCEPTTWASGCSLILNFREMPISPRFDPQIFLYYEDADLCLTLRKQGQACFVTNEVLVEHAVSTTTLQKPRSMHRHATFGKLYVLAKHGSILSVFLNFLYFLIWPLATSRDWPQIAGRLEGLVDFLVLLARLAIGKRDIYHPITDFSSGSH
jgi:N-acetylglucosaminyl-diphospho-decaprenol L-rhamnosyltransferase